DKVSCTMFPLQGAQMLQMLEKSLRKSLPTSLKVYGTVFHMNQGNPFKLKALVDKWPDFNTVVIRPQEQENCTNPDYMTPVVQQQHRAHHQSSQSSLNEVIQSLPATKSFKVKRSQNILYMAIEAIRELAPSLLDIKNLSLSDGKPKAIDQEMFKLSSLDPTHAAVVNKFWHFGGNEWSRRFIERCIRTFPNFCLLGPEGTPVSWSLMDQTGEMRMGGTLPEYRAHGLVTYVIYYQTQALIERGFPVYSHVDKNNKIMQKMSHSLNHIPVPCDWNQWNCVPL
ncbi:hypothetical protein E2I00_015169, partial [Balaenoptera physalus]